MKRYRYNKTSLFLIELIFAIFFFSISAAICMRMLGTAKLNTVYSENLSHACIKATAAAEVYKSCYGNLLQTADLLDGIKEGNKIVVFYDADWQVSPDIEGEFKLLIEQNTKNGSFSEALISVFKIEITDSLKEVEIFTLKTGSAGELDG